MIPERYCEEGKWGSECTDITMEYGLHTGLLAYTISKYRIGDQYQNFNLSMQINTQKCTKCTNCDRVKETNSSP